MNYRREIDGLRALAVLPVMLFHAGFETFSGGYIGVDVFFVISGYLITTIILHSLEEGRFSALVFYERRMRRLLPALFVVLLTSFAFAWLWLLPADMERFSASLASVPLFASNILFWRTSGYFDSASELKPLLHTWSLAVEEQFYLLYPLVVLLVWKRGPRVFLAVLATGAALSFALAIWGSPVRPAATFYLLPTRAWELALGAITAVHLWRHGPSSAHPAVASLGGLVGLALIGTAVVAFDTRTPFPGPYALVPTVGAVLILCYASPASWTGRLLGARWLVGIGLVSYSAYLWHQPLLALARHRFLGHIEPLAAAGLVVAALVLAAMTWKYVEQPFRDPRRVGRGPALGLAVVGSIAFVAAGLAGELTDGYAFRLPQDQRNFLERFDNSRPDLAYHMRELTHRFRDDCNFYDLAAEVQGDATRRPKAAIAPSCHTRDPSRPHAVFLWGDSHAQQLRPGLDATLPAAWQVLQVASSGCVAGIAPASATDFCSHSNQMAMKTIAATRPDVVLVAQADGHRIQAMEVLAARLRGLGVRKVLFMGPTPHWTTGLPDIVVRQAWSDPSQRLSIGVDQRFLALDVQLKGHFAQHVGVDYFSAIDHFCDAQGCLVHLGDDLVSGLTAYDNAHLTPVASVWLAGKALARAVMAPADSADQR